VFRRALAVILYTVIEMINLNVSRRFWAKVNKDGPIPEARPDLGPCWLWTGAKQPSGYGNFRYGVAWKGAHVVAYVLAYGPLPFDQEVDHLCCNRSCVRASHLEAVTHYVNLMRGDTWAARNKAKTHCPKGHPYVATNLMNRRDGKRVCRTCYSQNVGLKATPVLCS